ncbi:hypothetical protein GEMRC1_001254 [Eukaryota sp. GEM-RC1]
MSRPNVSSFVLAHDNSVHEASRSTSCKHSEVPSNSADIVSQLFLNKQKQFLTDKAIVFHGQSYPCHSSFLSSFSPVFKEKLLSSDPEVNFPQLEFIVPDADLVFQILDYCYGQPFQLTFDNMTNVLSLCSALDLSSLSDSIHNIMSKGFSKSRHLQLKSDDVLQTIKSTVQRDVMISYNDKSLTISSLVLICSSEFFKNLFCLNFADSNDRKFSFKDQFSGVSYSNFEIFFNYFIGESFNLDINNVIDFYQLSVYFVVKNLKKTCDSFVSSLMSARDILCLLKTIAERDALLILVRNYQIIEKLNNVRVLRSPFPLPLSFISFLLSVVRPSWVLQCLSVSISHQDVEEDYHSLSEIFERIVVTDQNIQQKHQHLLPLFNQNIIHELLFSWSMDVFMRIKNVRCIPDEWFLWSLSINSYNQWGGKFVNNDFFVENFAVIMDSNDIVEVTNYPYLTPQVFTNLKNVLPPLYDTFLCNCLLKSWRETDLWSVPQFEDLLLNLNFGSLADTILFWRIYQN